MLVDSRINRYLPSDVCTLVKGSVHLERHVLSHWPKFILLSIVAVIPREFELRLIHRSSYVLSRGGNKWFRNAKLPAPSSVRDSVYMNAFRNRSLFESVPWNHARIVNSRYRNLSILITLPSVQDPVTSGTRSVCFWAIRLVVIRSDLVTREEERKFLLLFENLSDYILLRILETKILSFGV